jgi:hypothetical protein
MCYDQEKTQAPIDDYPLKQQAAQAQAQGSYVTEQNYAGGPRCNRPLMTEAQILAELFKYHAPNEVTLPKYAAINQAAKNFAEVVLQNCPAGADRSGAINIIRTARMVANAAVALNGLSL